MDDLALSEDAAGWAVETWGLALGIIDEAKLSPEWPHSIILKKQSDLILTLAPGVILELVRVPAGKFIMGSDKNKDKMADYNETPQHKVYLEEYLIGKYLVTVAQFAIFVKVRDYKTAAEKSGSGITLTGSTWDIVKGADWQHPRGPGSDVSRKADHPVTLVSRFDAVAFCEWASQVSGREVRLPSEAEWEKAARGTDGRNWPWGNQAPDRDTGNFTMNVKDTTPVGKYSPKGDSPYGCADMTGNVWEWTSSLWKGYPYDTQDGREDLHSTNACVLRGGAFNNSQSGVRCASRLCNDFPTVNCAGNSGFRVWVSPI